MAKKSVNSEIQENERPYRAFFLPIDDTDGDAVRLPYNPEAWTTEHNPAWSAQNIAGAEKDDSQWEGNQARQVQFSQLVGSRDAAQLEQTLQQLERYALEPTVDTQRPTLLYLVLGYAHRFRGRIDRLSIERRQVDERGRAIQAQIDLTFVEHPDNGELSYADLVASAEAR